MFVVTSSQEPDECPIANTKARSAYGTDPVPMMELMKKLGARPVVGPLISSEHRSFSVVEAPRVEAMREFLVQTGLVQWNVNEIIHVITQEKAPKELNSLKPIY